MTLKFASTANILVVLEVLRFTALKISKQFGITLQIRLRRLKRIFKSLVVVAKALKCLPMQNAWKGKKDYE